MHGVGCPTHPQTGLLCSGQYHMTKVIHEVDCPAVPTPGQDYSVRDSVRVVDDICQV